MRIKQVNEYSGGGYGEVGKGFMDTGPQTLDKTSDLVKQSKQENTRQTQTTNPNTQIKKVDPVNRCRHSR